MIYLDNASTTQINPEVKKAMMPFFDNEFGNPSSNHFLGQGARAAADKSRQTIADFLGCGFTEVYFTSGATEANNLAIKGAVFNNIFKISSRPSFIKRGYVDSSLLQREAGRDFRSLVPHIITSRIEHKSVLKSVESLVKKDKAEVTYLPVNKDGIVDIGNLESEIKENTVLISVMYVNNETGVIQPVKEIGEIVKKYREGNKSQYPLFHIDVVQAVDYLGVIASEAINLSGERMVHGEAKQSRGSDSDPRNNNGIASVTSFPRNDNYSLVRDLNCDLLSLSSHKIYGPKGVGALYVKDGTPIMPLIEGGMQENGVRAGTENVPCIVGFGKAVKLVGSPIFNSQFSISNKIPNSKSQIPNTTKLRNYFEENVLKNIKNTSVNGSSGNRAPHISNILFKGVEAESLVILLDQEGIMASSGSACQAKAIEPSHVLVAMGLSKKDAMSSVRFSLGRNTTKKEIDKVLEVFPKMVAKLRR